MNVDAGEFDQVAGAIVILPPEGALVPVNLNALIFATNEYVFLDVSVIIRWRSFLTINCRPVVSPPARSDRV